ncbi:MAG: dihydropteroate synthase [Nevskiaceae bacterium]|nr:MAG: dihydropteroate synthase [Nevskiaceae bacterium]
MLLRLKTRWLDLSAPLVMGVLNVTPDSFSDGGQHAAPDAALRRAREMLAEGAAILDVGGESTRPGAPPVCEQEELDRVIPVVEALCREFDCPISIDTMKPAVMDAACAAGAALVNDVNALRAPGAIEIVRKHGAAVCLMHMQGEPRTMQQAPSYQDVTAEVAAYLRGRIDDCLAEGIDPASVMVDPGFGFGKTVEHNLELLARLEELLPLGRPILVGLSRKSMFKALLGLEVSQRMQASATAAALAVSQGAVIVRAHDVRATVEAIAIAAAVRGRRRVQS